MIASPTGQDLKLEIGENFSGQVAFGENIFQVGSMYGGVINRFETAVRRLAYPTPVLLRPRSVSLFLDRQQEFQTAARVLEQGDTVQLYGEPGIGKTWLLRRLGNELSDFADGIIYLRAQRKPLEDILQTIFDSFYYYEGHVPIKPTAASMRQALRDKEALILIDDLELSRQAIEDLIGTMEYASFLLVSSDRTFWGEGRAVALKGLPPADSLALLVEKLGRAISEAEEQVSQQICAALNGHPLRIFQAAAAMLDDEISLADFWQRLQQETAPRQIVEELTPPEEAILLQMAAVDAPLTAEHIQDLTDNTNAPQTLSELARKGWLEAVDTRYYQLSPEQLIIMHLAQLGGGPATLDGLTARTQRGDTAVILDKLVAAGQVEVEGPPDGQQQYKLAPMQRAITQLWQLDGEPATARQLSRLAGVAPLLGHLIQTGHLIPKQDEPSRSLYQLAPAQQVLLHMAALGGGPVSPSQLNPYLAMSDAAPLLEQLREQELVELVAQYRLLGSGALPFAQNNDLTPWRERALEYFRERALRLRPEPYRLAADIEPIQSLMDWAMATEKWAAAIDLAQGAESALSLNKDWQTWEQMLNQCLTAATQAENESALAWALHQLGSRDRLLGNNWDALKTLVKAYRMRRQLGELDAASVTYHNLFPLLIWRSNGNGRKGHISTGMFDLILTVLVALAGIASALILFLLLQPDGDSDTTVPLPPTITVSAVAMITETHTPTSSPTPTPSTTHTPTPTSTPSQTPTFTPTPCFPAPPGSWVSTTIQRGDTLSRLSVKHNASIAQIQQVNCLPDTVIRAGEPLWLPYIPPTPTPAPFLAVSGLRQSGVLQFNPNEIVVPLAIQLGNQGGSDADLSSLAVFYDVGNGQRVPASTTGDALVGTLPPDSDAVLNRNVLLPPTQVGKTVSIWAVAENETAVSIYLLLPPPIVRIQYNNGNPKPVAIHDIANKRWLTVVSLKGIVDGGAQVTSWTWTLSDRTTYEGQNMPPHPFTGPNECIPYHITLSVEAVYHGYATSGTASVSSQCR